MALQQTVTHTKIANPQLKQIVRIAWIISVISIVVVFYSSLPGYFEVLRDSPLWGAGYEPVLTQYGMSRASFALYFATLETVSFTIMTIFACIIFTIRNDDWMALLISMMMVLVGSTTALNVHYTNHFFGSILIGSGLFITFAALLVFPDGRFQPGLSRYVLALFAPLYMIVAPSGSILLGGQSLPTIQFIAFFVVFSSPALGLLAQIYRYRAVASPVQKQQTKWILLGFIGWVLMSFVYLGIQVFFPQLRLPSIFPDAVIYALPALISLYILVPLLLISLNLIPFTFGLSILRYRLWNIDIVINRSLVYSLQTIMLTVIFALVFATLHTFLTFISGGSQDGIVAIISTAVVILAFNPVRRQARHFIDRNLYGLRFDLNELNRAQKPVSITNPGKLTGEQFGDYEVCGVIGKGGMGEVYEGFGDGKRVAIKTMLPDIAIKSDMKIRFEREVEIGLSLKNPHIAEVYTSGDYQNTAYLVMEYIAGQDLGDVLDLERKFDYETACQITKDICLALSVAHEQGYIHRDIKPSNIMLRENGSAVLMDFGISKIQDAKTITGTGAVGTIYYMAPEQIISSKDVDFRADIYALGAVLYQMLTGETPFTGGVAQVMFAQIQQPAPDPRIIQPDIPDPIAEAILKAMKKDPDSRFQSVEEFANALSG